MNQNITSILYDVYFGIKDTPHSADREAIYVPTDGSVNFDTLNRFVRDEIAKRRHVPSETVHLINIYRLA